MIIVVEKGTGVVKYAVDDRELVDFAETSLVIGKTTVLDLNGENAEIVRGVTNLPGDFTGCRYTYDGTVGEFSLVVGN